MTETSDPPRNMFHTFETTQYSSPELTKFSDASNKRRTSTVRACEPCRRRKIRCNGEHPCETCQWYRKADSCHYTEPRQRQMPSRRSIEKIAAALQQYRGILQKLYPQTHPDALADLSRERLIELISKSSPRAPPSPVTSSPDDKMPSADPDAASLEKFQPMPEESADTIDLVQKDVTGVTDDVNALSLSMKHSSSYLGISSVMAVLRVIVWLDPEAQTYFTRTPDRTAMTSREQSPPPESLMLHDHDITPRIDTRHDPTTSAWDEIPLINAYFAYVHTFIPIIEEQTFRDTYMSARRSDPRWLLLLNTVLAMGSMAAGTAEDTTHKIYFSRAKVHLSIDTLGQAHIETIQALAILGGFYLHYLQQPTIANSLMGATLRMATTLGLHREYLDGAPSTPSKGPDSSVDMRRRVWWCLFNLDAWSSSTLGRPSMGRNGYAVTVESPQNPIAPSPQLLTLLQENIRFCALSTRLEDALAACPLIPASELASLDNSFVDWYRNSSCHYDTPRPEILGQEPIGVTVTKNVMRWRYLSARIILHRPVLLWYAMRKMPFDDLSEEKQEAINVCRECTSEVISDIAAIWQAQRLCLMSGWNATWLLYQAVMVPLLSLFSDAEDETIVEQSRQQVETALMTLTELRCWSPTAKRSFEVVSRIYEASKRWKQPSITYPQQYHQYQHVLHPNTHPLHNNNSDTPTLTSDYSSAFAPFQNSAFRPGGDPSALSTVSQEMLMDTMFDSLTWSTGWNSLDYPFESPSAGWDYSAWGGVSGVAAFDGYFDPTLQGTTSVAANGYGGGGVGMGHPTPGTVAGQHVARDGEMQRDQDGYGFAS